MNSTRSPIQSSDEWARLIKETHRRNGPVELAHNEIPKPRKTDNPDNPPTPILHRWRARLLDINNDHLIIEQPALGVGGDLHRMHVGMQLDGLIEQGQYRWLFTTKVLDRTFFKLNAQQRVVCLKLSPPQHIEKTQRRRFYRVSTTGAKSSRITIWPLTNTKGCRDLELANEQLHSPLPNDPAEKPKPAVTSFGDPFNGTLVNIGGGGAFVSVNLDRQNIFKSHSLFWLSLGLPNVDAPIHVVARVCHSSPNRHAHTLQLGLAFEFSHNPAHQRFVEDIICRFTAEEQRRQLQRERLAV